MRTRTSTTSAPASPISPETRNVPRSPLAKASSTQTRAAGPAASSSPARPEASASAVPGPWPEPPSPSFSPAWKTAPSTAMPSAMPSCRAVLRAPPAMPARAGATAPNAAAASAGVAMPTPRPVTTRPGTSADQPSPASVIQAWSRAPAPISSSPPPMVSRAGAPCSIRPATAETANAARLSGTSTRPAETGPIPSADCSQRETYIRYENAAPDSSSAPAMTPTKVRLRNSERSSIGRELRSSMRTKAAEAAAPRPNRPRVAAPVQPFSPTRIRAYVTAAAPVVKAAMPGRSRPLARGSRDSATDRRVTYTARAQTGRLTKKIQRQPKCSVSSPPMIGPAAAAAPLTAPQTPKAIPRSRPW